MPQLIFPNLRAAKEATALEFTPRLAAAHRFIKLADGRYVRQFISVKGKG